MQRRAAAISVAFFLVVAGGAYALAGAAEEPAVSIDADERDHVVSGDGFATIDGVEYNVSFGDGESAEATWLNESARETATLENGSAVDYENDSYRVAIPNASQPDLFRLVENQTVDRETVEQNGTTWVVVEDGENRTLVPVDEYLPDPTVYTLRTGNEFPYENNTTTVAAISPDAVTLEWFVDRNETVSFDEGENTTLGDTTYKAHFPDANTLALTTNFQAYAEEESQVSYFHERRSGLWGVVILSGFAAILMAGVAYLPSRY